MRVFIALLLCFYFDSSVFAATVNVTNVEDLEQKPRAVSKWRVNVDVEFVNANEKSMIAELEYRPELKLEPHVILIANNRNGADAYAGLQHVAGKHTAKVVYYLTTWDKRKIKIAEFVPG